MGEGEVSVDGEERKEGEGHEGTAERDGTLFVLHASARITVPAWLIFSYMCSGWNGPTRAAMWKTQSIPCVALLCWEAVVR